MPVTYKGRLEHRERLKYTMVFVYQLDFCLFSVIIILRYEELLDYSIDNLNGYIWKEMEIMKTKNSWKRSLTQKVKVKHNNQLTLTTPNNELNEDST